jgi:opacity protein-like surface antigen
MRKFTIILISALFALTSSAFAAGLVGVKLGQGYLEGNANAYTAGSNSYAAESGTKGSAFGAIFAEISVMESPISAGIEYVPFDADISLNGQNNTVSANLSDYTTVYALAAHEISDELSVYAKIGYSMAEIGAVKPNDAATTVNSQSDSLEGMVYGFGFQSELPMGIVARAEYTYTDFDEISVTTTSHGSSAAKKTADGNLNAVTLSFAKSF